MGTIKGKFERTSVDVRRLYLAGEKTICSLAGAQEVCQHSNLTWKKSRYQVLTLPQNQCDNNVNVTET